MATSVSLPNGMGIVTHVPLLVMYETRSDPGTVPSNRSIASLAGDNHHGEFVRNEPSFRSLRGGSGHP
jgi:hypothetical protein